MKNKVIKTNKKITLDSCDWAHTTATLLSNGDVLIESLYRYGKPSSHIMTKEKFISWRNDIAKTSQQEYKYNF
jgi:hypothetical protein